MENLGLDPSDPLPPQSEQLVDLAEDSFAFLISPAPECKKCCLSLVRMSLMLQIRNCLSLGIDLKACICCDGLMLD